MIWVYILKCSDGRYYTGSHKGRDPRAREAQHNSGFDPKAYTYNRRPVKLIWAESFDDYIEAFSMERRIKTWSRAKKEALMCSDWDELVRLSNFKKAKSADPSSRPSTSSG